MNNEDFEEIAKISKEYSDLKPLTSMARDFLSYKRLCVELIGSDDLEMKKEAEVEEERRKKI